MTVKELIMKLQAPNDLNVIVIDDDNFGEIALNCKLEYAKWYISNKWSDAIGEKEYELAMDVASYEFKNNCLIIDACY